MKQDDQSRYHRDEYIVRINRVIDYIEKHLDTELTLDTLAGVANFSSFHFHRIFRAIVGETLNAYIRRLRVEKAVSQLVNNPGKTITEIALDCGFSGSASPKLSKKLNCPLLRSSAAALPSSMARSSAASMAARCAPRASNAPHLMSASMVVRFVTRRSTCSQK